MTAELFDAPTKTIKEIKQRIIDLEANEESYLSTMILIWKETQPKAIDTTLEKVFGGTRTEKFLEYLINCEGPKYQNSLKKYNIAFEERQSLIRLLEKRLEAIGELAPKVKRIVELRETTTMSWEKIAEDKEVDLSAKHCIRLYKTKYLGYRSF